MAILRPPERRPFITPPLPLHGNPTGAPRRPAGREQFFHIPVALQDESRRCPQDTRVFNLRAGVGRNLSGCLCEFGWKMPRGSCDSLITSVFFEMVDNYWSLQFMCGCTCTCTCLLCVSVNDSAGSKVWPIYYIHIVLNANNVHVKFMF